MPLSSTPLARRLGSAVGLALAGLCLCPTLGGAQAPPLPPKRAPIAFTSAFTDFARDCRSAIPHLPPPGSLEARLGTPVPLVCRGPGGQAVFVSFDAHMAVIAIGAADPMDGRHRHLATQPRDFVHRPGRRLEWRLANGRPFGAMLRITGNPETGAPDGFGVGGSRTRVVPQALLVAAGLPGFEQVDTSMEVDKTNAETLFREAVDALYLPPTPWPPRP